MDRSSLWSASSGGLYLLADDGALLGLWAHNVAFGRELILQR